MYNKTFLVRLTTEQLAKFKQALRIYRGSMSGTARDLVVEWSDEIVKRDDIMAGFGNQDEWINEMANKLSAPRKFKFKWLATSPAAKLAAFQWATHVAVSIWPEQVVREPTKFGCEADAIVMATTPTLTVEDIETVAKLIGCELVEVKDEAV